MKHKLACIILSAVIILTGSAHRLEAALDPFAIQSVLGSPPEQNSAVASVEAGGLLEFSAADLERRLGLSAGALKGVTVTSLPARETGGLFVDGVEVEAYDFLERDELDRLCFAAADLNETAAIGLLPQAKGGAATTLSIQILPQANRPPTVEGPPLETGRNIPAYGYLNAWDPDGDSVTLRLVTAPKKGEVRFDGLGFVYQPWHNKTGSDSFTVCAVDSKGAYSADAVIGVTIGRQKRSFYYSDMVVHPSQYAALMLHEEGVYTGACIGSSYFFEPEAQMNRGEFLMLLITAAGYAEAMTPTVNTGLPEDEKIPSHYKRYVKKAIEEGILSPELAFGWNETPTRAECVVLTARAAKISDVKSYALTMSDAAALPQWAVASYQELAAYRMLDLYDGAAHPQRALTNAYAADLLWQLYKHTHRR